MVGLIIAPSKSIDSHGGNLERTSIPSAKQGDVGQKVDDTLTKQPSILGNTAAPLPATGPLTKVLNTLSAIYKKIKSVITRILGYITSLFCRRTSNNRKKADRDLTKRVQKSLGSYMARVNNPETTYAEKLCAFSESLNQADLLVIEERKLESKDVDELPEFIYPHCRSIYDNLPEVIRKGLDAFLQVRLAEVNELMPEVEEMTIKAGVQAPEIRTAINSTSEVGAITIQAGLQAPEVRAAIDRMYESFPSLILTQNQKMFNAAETELDQVEVLLEMMQIEVVDFDPEVTKASLQLSIQQILQKLEVDLRNQLENEIWRAVVDPGSTSCDRMTLESMEAKTVYLTDSQESLLSSDSEFSLKVLGRDPCGTVAQAGVSRWIAYKNKTEFCVGIPEENLAKSHRGIVNLGGLSESMVGESVRPEIDHILTSKQDDTSADLNSEDKACEIDHILTSKQDDTSADLTSFLLSIQNSKEKACEIDLMLWVEKESSSLDQSTDL